MPFGGNGLKAAINELEATITELTRKGESLCHQNGNLLIQEHDLKNRIVELEHLCSELAAERDRYRDDWIKEHTRVEQILLRFGLRPDR